jgi:molecular chaperone GrpE (heat shock protein)
MTHCEQLHKLLTEKVIHEVNNVVKQMEEFISTAGELSPQMKEEQEGIRAIRDNFLNIIEAIETEQIDQKNCEEIIMELNMFRMMGEAPLE